MAVLTEMPTPPGEQPAGGIEAPSRSENKGERLPLLTGPELPSL